MCVGRSGFTCDYILLIVVAASAALMCNRLGEAFGGFHGMSEAYFTELGRSIAEGGFHYPHKPDGSLDVNIPPLTAYLLGLSFMIFGVSESSARLVPVTFSLMSVTVTYLIGRRLYGRTAGLCAAAVLAFTPMHVLVGRNVQSDALMVALGLAAVYFYVNKRPVISGFTLGLCFLAKQPAVLFYIGLAVLEFADKRSFRADFLRLTAVFAATVSPYVCLLYTSPSPRDS